MIAFVVIFVSEQERCRCYGIQTSLTSLITSVFEKWRVLNLTQFKLYFIFNFCTFKKIGKLVLIFSLRILRVILHKTIVHALVLILHMKPFHISIHGFLVFYCRVTVAPPKEGHHRWHPVWFYHMCLSYDFYFALYIYVNKWLSFSFQMFLSENTLWNKCYLIIHGYWVDWCTFRVIKGYNKLVMEADWVQLRENVSKITRVLQQ